MGIIMQTQVWPAWTVSILFAILSMISLLPIQSICLRFRIIKVHAQYVLIVRKSKLSLFIVTSEVISDNTQGVILYSFPQSSWGHTYAKKKKSLALFISNKISVIWRMPDKEKPRSDTRRIRRPKRLDFCSGWSKRNSGRLTMLWAIWGNHLFWWLFRNAAEKAAEELGIGMVDMEKKQVLSILMMIFNKNMHSEMQNSVRLLEMKILRRDLSDLHIYAHSKTNRGKNF